MYTQEELDQIYYNQVVAYDKALKLERLKNYFSIVASIVTILMAFYYLTKNK